VGVGVVNLRLKGKAGLLFFYVLVDVIILGLFGWSKINCFVGKLIVGVGEEFIFGEWELSH
jgi:hypothetical protein